MCKVKLYLPTTVSSTYKATKSFKAVK